MGILNKILGTKTSEDECLTYLDKLGFTFMEGKIKVPTHRNDIETINTQIENHKQWLDTHPNESYDVYDSRQKDIEGIISPIMTKLYQSAGGMPGNMPGGMPGEMPGGMPGATPESMASENVSVEEVD